MSSEIRAADLVMASGPAPHKTPDPIFHTPPPERRAYIQFSQRTSIGYTYAELLAVGVLWTVLTVGFEFLVGYVEGTPVSVTLGQYDMLAGQVWIAVPITLLVSPLIFGWYLSA